MNATKVKKPGRSKSNSVSKDKSAVIRLRKSKAFFDALPNTNGRLAGIHFVLNFATWEEMRILEELGVPWTDSFYNIAVKMRRHRNCVGLVKMLETKFGADINHPVWIKAFVTGALEKFHELESLVQNCEIQPMDRSDNSAPSEPALRERALHSGFRLVKSTCSQKNSNDSTYQICDFDDLVVAAGTSGSFGLTLQQCEDYLNGDKTHSCEQ